MSTQNPILPNEQAEFKHPLWRRFFRGLLARSSVSGTETFSAGTTVAVTLATPLPDTDYNVLLSTPENKTFWVTSPTTTGFTLNASASTSATVGYTIVRR